jgi:hypothetical protein
MRTVNFLEFGSRVLSAAAIMVGHAALGAVAVVCMWGLEHLIALLGGGTEMLIYGKWPLEYLFQTVDLAMVLVIAIGGLWEMFGVLTGRHGP